MGKVLHEAREGASVKGNGIEKLFLKQYITESLIHVLSKSVLFKQTLCQSVNFA